MRRQFSITVRFRRPRKSILTRPTSAQSFMSNWADRFAVHGRKAERSRRSAWLDITTPAACTPALRAMPSTLRASSTISRVSASSLHHLLNSGRLESVFQLYSGTFGHGLGDFIHLGQRDVHHPSHVAQGGARLQTTEGHDLGHFVFAVLAPTILDHFSSTFHAEVGVDVGQFGSLRVEEALEE